LEAPGPAVEVPGPAPGQEVDEPVAPLNGNEPAGPAGPAGDDGGEG
jgi:hypothetical protein